MDMVEYDQTTTIAITLEVKEMLKIIKLVPEESWNNVIRRFLISHGVKPLNRQNLG